MKPSLNKELISSKYYDEKLSCREIATILGCTEHQVYYFMRKNNMPRRSLSLCKVGNKNPFYGKQHSDETKKKIAKAQSGTIHTPEHRYKTGSAFRGKKRPQHSKRMTGAGNPMFGVPSPSRGKQGKAAPNWQGGKTIVQKLVRSCRRYDSWRRQIFQRDNFTCQWCGDATGGNLNADHIKPFSMILRENMINSLEKALECQELWSLENGRTLCVECHKQTESYGNRTSGI